MIFNSKDYSSSIGSTLGFNHYSHLDILGHQKKRGGLWFISGRRETRNYSELVLGPKQVQAILSETGFDSDFVEASVAGRAEVMNFWIGHEMMRKVVMKILGYFRILFSDKGIR